jgi:head-tail adaptor
MLTIGELDRRIKLYTANPEENTFGEYTYTYELNSTVWAKVFEKSGKLTEESDEMVYINKTIFYIRAQQNLSNSQIIQGKIEWDNRIYIPEVINEIDGRERFLEVITTEKDNNIAE